MYPKNLVALVELVLLMNLVYTCPALGSTLRGNLIRCYRILSNWHTVTPLEVRRVRVLRNRCRYLVGPVINSRLPPFYRFSQGASPSPLTWRRSFLAPSSKWFRCIMVAIFRHRLDEFHRVVFVFAHEGAATWYI